MRAVILVIRQVISELGRRIAVAGASGLVVDDLALEAIISIDCPRNRTMPVARCPPQHRFSRNASGAFEGFENE